MTLPQQFAETRDWLHALAEAAVGFSPAGASTRWPARGRNTSGPAETLQAGVR